MIRILLTHPAAKSASTDLIDLSAAQLAGKKISELNDDELRLLAEILCRLQGICDPQGMLQSGVQTSD